MGAIDSVKGWKAERDRTAIYPLFVGAVAVSRSETLVADEHSLIRAVARLKEGIDEVPERFRHRIEHFDIKKSHVQPVSDEADNLFRRLWGYADRVSWIDYWGSLGPDRGNGYRGNQYIMDDADAVTFIAKEGFTPEELDWLWEFAQALHKLPEKPVERRVFREQSP